MGYNVPILIPILMLHFVLFVEQKKKKKSLLIMKFHLKSLQLQNQEGERGKAHHREIW